MWESFDKQHAYSQCLYKKQTSIRSHLPGAAQLHPAKANRFYRMAGSYHGNGASLPTVLGLSWPKCGLQPRRAQALCFGKARDIDGPQRALQRGTGSMTALQLQYSRNNLPPLALVPGAAPLVMGRSKDATAGGLVDPFVSRKHASFAWASEDSVALTAHSKVHVVVRGALDAVPVDAGTTTTVSSSINLNFS